MPSNYDIYGMVKSKNRTFLTTGEFSSKHKNSFNNIKKNKKEEMKEVSEYEK